jgi:hypothetical protein
MPTLNENDQQPIEKKTDCDCEDGCCQPKKKPEWIKYLFFLVILAALSIIVIKVVQDKKNPSENSPQSGQPCCPDSSKTAACDTSKGTSCCPKSGK